MADQIIMLPARDSSGNALAGAKARVELSGTTTPVTVYADQGETTPLAQPILSDADGEFVKAFTSQAPVRLIITDANDVILPGYPSDPAYVTQASGTSAENTSFTPIANNPQGNVQDAITFVSNAAVSGNFDENVSVTGPSPTLSTDNSNTNTDLAWRMLMDGVVVFRVVRDVSAGLTLLEARDNAGANPKSLVIPDASISAGSNSSMLLSAGEMDARYKEHRTLAGQGLTGLTGLSITDLPANIEQLAISFAGVSIDASDSILVQLGTSSGFVTTGYAGRSTDFIGGYEPTSGFGIIVGSAASQFSGTMRLTRCSDDRYSQDHGGYLSVLNRNVVGGGLANFLSDVTQLRVLTGSSGTFDNGIVQVHAITSPF